MLTLTFGIWASEPPRAWRTTEKAGPDRVKDMTEKIPDKRDTLYYWETRGPEFTQLNGFYNVRG